MYCKNYECTIIAIYFLLVHTSKATILNSPPNNKLLAAENIPEYFDAREKWPNCESIGKIRDQMNCGAGWAFAAVATMTDRLCIQTNGTVKFEFSPEDFLSCCRECDFCNVGNATKAWQYWVENGLVSGGDYPSNEGCKPYSYSSSQTIIIPPCRKTCRSDYNISYEDDLHFGDHFYKINGNVEDIQLEILTNGPVQAFFVLYEDFFLYTDGIFQHKSNYGVMGYTYVKILGWGSENGTLYWLAATSLGNNWGGLNGFFKTIRGVNEAKIEEDITAGIAKLTGGNDGDSGDNNFSPKSSAVPFYTMCIYIIFILASFS